MTIDGSKNCIYLHSKENRTEKWTRYDTNDKKSHTDLSKRIRKQALKLQQENKSLQPQDKRTGSETMCQKGTQTVLIPRNHLVPVHLCWAGKMFLILPEKWVESHQYSHCITLPTKGSSRALT